MDSELFNEDGKWLMYTRQKKGPIAEPCGTPFSILDILDPYFSALF
jgi:hypothetical protein